MTTKYALSILQGDVKLPDEYVKLKKQKEDVYYCMSLHTCGATPRFIPLGYRKEYYTPKSYFGIEYQKIFENRLLSRHPREGEETLQWRLSQYKPITRTPFLQIIELTSSSIFQNSNYYIEVEDISEEKYIKNPNFDNLSLTDWIKQMAFQSIVEDPNGFIIRIPTRPYNQITTNKVQVKILFVKTIDIIYNDEESILFRNNGDIYLIDENNIWKILKLEDETYVSEGYYYHGFGYLPATVAGGVWNTQGFYDSYLVKAQAIADEFVSSYSSEQLVDKEASHPFIIQGEQDCKMCDGLGERIVECDGSVEGCEHGYHKVPCDACGGKGVISNNPGERKIVPMEDMDKDHIKIINPDTTINTYHHKKNADLYDMMIDALNLWRLEQRQSGTAKIIDQERLYLFISNISNHIFDSIVTESIKDILNYRNLTVINDVVIPSAISFTIMKPTQYQVKSSLDLLNEYKEGVISGMPFYIRAKMAIDFIARQYAGDAVMKKKAAIIYEMDAVYCYTSNEKRRALENGAISIEEVAKSTQIPFFLNELISNIGDTAFVEMDKFKIKKLIDKKFTKYWSANKDALQMSSKGYDFQNLDNVTQ